MNRFESYLNDLTSYLAGTDVTVSGSDPESFTIEFHAGDASDPMPKILDIQTELYSDGEAYYIYFDPVIQFPTIRTAELDYADSLEYLLKEWKKLGKAVRIIRTTPYELESKYDYED